VVRADDVTAARAGRPGGELVLVDLAVPRDVDPACASVPGVAVFDITTLRERVVSHAPETADDIARAQELIAQEVRRWVARRRGDELAPVIRAIRAHGEAVIEAEFARLGSRLAALDPDERAAVEALVRGVAAKLLHDPIVGLKERVEPAREREVAALLAQLLDLPDPAAER
jgi:glutamyl-tRNA reductase